MKIVAIVQARTGSSRLPGKVLKAICGTPMIDLLLGRLSKSVHLSQIVVATTTEKRDDLLASHIAEIGYTCVRGAELDVLARFEQAARETKGNIFVRITGDCPLVDPSLIDKAIEGFLSSGVDYLSNVSPPTFPDGLDIEVFSRSALQKVSRLTSEPFDREHVTPFFRTSGLFSTGSMENAENLAHLRWTVDEQADFEVITKVFESFFPDIHFSWLRVLELQEKQPELFYANSQIKRNEGTKMGSGQKLWKRAKELIPGGNMLLSKRPEMFAPEQWPAYFSKSKGCFVWDLDGNQFIDTSIMGVGTNILGYGHPEVDAAVQGAIAFGNMSSLNCPEEIVLAEKLIQMHPWADMVRFARSGGEANAIAIRIARAASGKDGVAVCGYHGWHDWYLAANLSDDESLSGHLLPGLSPNGVPRNLRGTVHTFNYNNYEELLHLVDTQEIGVIKMEVVRNEGPQNDFLQRVRRLATERGIVLVFDECTSGFREAFGGLHKVYGVEPDMAMFGKALGNGYAITATIGRREIMEAAQSTFISSTFWTERIGPTAALKTLEVMEREQSWVAVTEIGKKVRLGWQALADAYGIPIMHWGLPALAGFTFESDNALAYKTLITQEMLKKGFLSGNCLYASTAHTDEILDQYFDNLDRVFALISECENGKDPASLLEGPVCHAGFKRLN